MKYKYSYLFLLVFAFLSCNQLDSSLLIGYWKGDQLIEKGVDKGAKLVEFSFNDNGVYTYQNSYYKEAGYYRISENKLYTKDSTREDALEKVVRISFLTNDTMHLEMNAKGIPQVLKCVKVKAE